MRLSLMKLSEFIYVVDSNTRNGMKASIKLIASERLLPTIDENVLEQALMSPVWPGLISPVCLLPDAHSGYGAPIGCVFASDFEMGELFLPEQSDLT